MLSRHAENLFWAGRYLERAEDTARILNVTYHSLLEAPYTDPAATWRDVCVVLRCLQGFEARGVAVNARNVTEYLVLDRTNPGSVVATVERARENARAVRELIPTELWEAINDFHFDLTGRNLVRELDEHSAQLYRSIREHCQAVAGVAAETMPRSDGYRFLVNGWMLERAEMTCRLLSVRYGQLTGSTRDADFHDWVSVLKSASALEAFRKAYRGSMRPADVVEFLLLSTNFPRSVFFCLRTAEHELIRLEAENVITTPLRLLGRLRSDLEFQDVPELMAGGDVRHFLDHVATAVSGVADALCERFFTQIPVGDIHRVSLTPGV